MEGEKKEKMQRGEETRIGDKFGEERTDDGMEGGKGGVTYIMAEEDG